MIDHVHLMLSIPPKYSVADVIGYIKGKSRFTLPGTLRAGRGISSGNTSGPADTSCPRWVETNRRFERTSRTRNEKIVA